MLWTPLKNEIRNNFCKSVEEVTAVVNKFQNNLNPEMCKPYIKKLNEVCWILLININY